MTMDRKVRLNSDESDDKLGDKESGRHYMPETFFDQIHDLVLKKTGLTLTQDNVRVARLPDIHVPSSEFVIGVATFTVGITADNEYEVSAQIDDHHPDDVVIKTHGMLGIMNAARKRLGVWYWAQSGRDIQVEKSFQSTVRNARWIKIRTADRKKAIHLFAKVLNAVLAASPKSSDQPR